MTAVSSFFTTWLVGFSFFTAAVAALKNELEPEFDALLDAMDETKLEVGCRVGAASGGEVKLFGTILYFFFFGKSFSVKPLDDDSNEFSGLIFSSPLRLRLWIVTCGELSADTLLKSMVY